MRKVARASGLILRNVLMALAPALAGIAVSHAATVRTVNSVVDTTDGVCDVSNCTLREAMTVAQGGDTIAFSSLFDAPQTINLTGVLPDISASLTITGPGADRLNVRRSSGGDYRIFLVAENANAHISGLTISNGKSGFGAGVLVHGSLIMEDAALTGNETTGGGGGGVYSDGTGIQVSRSTFSGNKAGEGAGIYVFRYTNAITTLAVLVNTTVSANSGPGISIVSDASGAVTLYVNNGTIAGNSGAGIVTTASGSAATTHLSNTIIADNGLASLVLNGVLASVASTAGNITSDDANGLLPDLGDLTNQVARLAPLGKYGGPTPTQPPQIGSPAINYGQTKSLSTDQRGVPRPQGGAFDSGAVELRSLVVNSAADPGDGVCDASCTLRDAMTAANADGPGVDDISFDAVVFAGPQTINLSGALPEIATSMAIAGPGADRLDVHRNLGGDYRILKVNSGAFANVSGLSISNGGGVAFGGGVNNLGDLVLANCAVRNNSATTYGGGVHNKGRLEVTSSTISNNSASGGGGVFTTTDAGVQQAPTAALINTTISGNTVTGSGSAIANVNFGGSATNLALLNCTIAGNSGTSGSVSISGQGGPALTSLKNTLVANNSLPNLGSGGPATVVISEGNNLASDDGSGLLITAGDQINKQPMLSALGYNGGHTQTQVPQFGSPAIDAGNNIGAPISDQRGISRPQGATVDIGAVEWSDSIFGNDFETL